MRSLAIAYHQMARRSALRIALVSSNLHGAILQPNAGQWFKPLLRADDLCAALFWLWRF